MIYKPRILAVLQLPPPIHGASVMNQAIADSKILNENFHIDYIALQFAISTSDVSVFRFDKVVRAIKLILKIIKQLNKFKYEIVYFTVSPNGYAFYRDAIFVTIFKLFKSNILYHLHGKGIRSSKKQPIKRLICRYVFFNTTLICLSKGLSTDLDGIHNIQLFTVNNGIPVFPKKEPGIVKKKSKISILYLSNLKSTKGIWIFIDALNLLYNKGLSFEVNIIGDNSITATKTKVQNRIKSLGMNDFVNVLGPKYGKEKYAFLDHADIFCFPSFNEAFPLVLLEAMQFGKAIVSTSEGAIPEIIDDKIEGILVKKGDTRGLAFSLQRLIKNEDLRKKLGKAAKQKFFSRYTLPDFENNMVQVFNTVSLFKDNYPKVF